MPRREANYISMYVPAELKVFLVKAAQAEGMSLSSFILQCTKERIYQKYAPPKASPESGK